MFLGLRDKTREMLRVSGAVRMEEVQNAAPCGGDSWMMIACFDLMVERGDIRRVDDPKLGFATQHRVYVGWSLFLGGR